MPATRTHNKLCSWRRKSEQQAKVLDMVRLTAKPNHLQFVITPPSPTRGVLNILELRSCEYFKFTGTGALKLGNCRSERSQPELTSERASLGWDHSPESPRWPNKRFTPGNYVGGYGRLNVHHSQPGLPEFVNGSRSFNRCVLGPNTWKLIRMYHLERGAKGTRKTEKT